jgi:curli biogenesis system outer membrane secretion channel CsgG
MRRSGIRALLTALSVFLAGCIYGFAGGGLPPHIKTVAVLPFENETSASMLQRELYDQLRREVEGRLGLREAAESRADAVVRGTISRYEIDIPAAYSSDPTQTNTAQRKLQITIDVEIVDQTTGRTLWSQKGMTKKGTYAEGSEDDGRRQAIEKIVNDVIAGAQSQW